MDLNIKDKIEQELTSLQKRLSDVEMFTLFSGDYDKNNCLLEIHAGAGGTEACDWTNMLYRMYTRYLEDHKFKYEVISLLDGEEAGIKSVSLKVEGLYAYGKLKSEKGVHRLVRLSPFDANNKRHTSFASVDIIPEFKIVVTCQNQRSQIQNREEAMRMLKNKLKLIEIEKRNQELQSVKGESMNIEFGSQIRSYVMHPYSLVKDHRTNNETSNVLKVLDGDLDSFIESYLKQNINL